MPADFQRKLELKAYLIDVYLGASEHERKSLQKVSVSLEFFLSHGFKAESTDQLEDALCYKKILEEVDRVVKHKKFSLIEKIASEISQCLKPFLPVQSEFIVHVKKIKPPLANLTGGVTYQLKDTVFKESGVITLK